MYKHGGFFRNFLHQFDDLIEKKKLVYVFINFFLHKHFAFFEGKFLQIRISLFSLPSRANLAIGLQSGNSFISSSCLHIDMGRGAKLFQSVEWTSHCFC